MPYPVSNWFVEHPLLVCQCVKEELDMLRYLPEFFRHVAIAIPGRTTHLLLGDFVVFVGDVFHQCGIESVLSGNIIQYAMNAGTMLYSKFPSIGVLPRNT